MSLILPEAKRRKIGSIESSDKMVVTKIGTEIRLNGTMTPSQTVETSNDAMDTKILASECPCGYLHGPGFNHYHDISAVGFSVDVMRGPE